MYYKHKRLKVHKHQLDFFGAIEAIIYEMKPIFYLTFAVGFLTSDFVAHSLTIKYASVGVALFGLYVIYSRLVNRGHI